MNERNEKAQRDLMDRRGVRLVLFLLIPLVIFLLVSAAIRVSQYGIDHTIIVLGQKELVANWPGAMRVTLISDGGQFYVPSRITCRLQRDENQYTLFDGGGDGDGASMAINFEVPQIASGPATLIFDIEFDERKRTVEARVHIVDEPGPESLVIPTDVRDKPEPNPLYKDGNTLRVFTEDRGAPTGMASVVFLRAQGKEGQPVSVPLELILPNDDSPLLKVQANRSVETDALGLFAVPAKPRELGWPMRVVGSTKDPSGSEEGDGGGSPILAEVPNPSSGASLHPHVVYAGLSAVLHNPIAHKGDRLRINARQLSVAGPLYVDLFKAGQWVQAESEAFRGGLARIEITPRFQGLGRMQLTSSVLAPGRSVLVRHFYILRKGDDLTSGLRAVLKALESSRLDEEWVKAVQNLPLNSGVGFDRRLANAFALSRLYSGHSLFHELIHSRRTDDTELSAYKGRFQRLVMLAILLIGLGVAALIAMVAMRAHRTQQRITQMILSESLDPDLDASEAVDPASARRRAWVQITVLFFIVMGAFISVAILVDTLTWQR